MELTVEELRVLGCLIEKQATTPDLCPLSTNALVNACNQKSNREPLVDYSERTVMDAMLLVRQKGLARMNSSGRTDKHRHILEDALGLDSDQLALLAVMMLRGPQSAGELKTRTERYATSQGTGFESIDDIEAVLTRLAEGVDPFAANIGRGSGQSQDRWAHLLGDVVPDVHQAAPGRVAQPADLGPSLAQRVAVLGGAACSAGIRTRRVVGAVVARRRRRPEGLRYQGATGRLRPRSGGRIRRRFGLCHLADEPRTHPVGFIRRSPIGFVIHRVTGSVVAGGCDASSIGENGERERSPT